MPAGRGGGGGRRHGVRRLLSRAAAAAAGRGAPPGRPAVDAEWAGRRWFEMRVGYGTYMAFMFGFASFILLLHGLADWFRDYPLHWFVLAAVAVIVPVSVLVGHRHNRTQQKTEARRLARLGPYVNLPAPRSKEVFLETQLHAMIDLMISTTHNPELRSELAGLRAALGRCMGGEAASGSPGGDACEGGRGACSPEAGGRRRQARLREPARRRHLRRMPQAGAGKAQASAQDAASGRPNAPPGAGGLLPPAPCAARLSTERIFDRRPRDSAEAPRAALPLPAFPFPRPV